MAKYLTAPEFKSFRDQCAADMGVREISPVYRTCTDGTVSHEYWSGIRNESQLLAVVFFYTDGEIERYAMRESA